MSWFFRLLMSVAIGATTAHGETVIETSVSNFELINFEKLKPTVYTNDGNAIRMQVDGSSSILFKPLTMAVPISEVSFEWKAEGSIAVQDAAMQKSKEGDDARLRVGLIIAGKAPLLPFFAPSWVKVIRERLKFPADKVEFVVAGTTLPPGTTWKSPFNSDIMLFAAEDRLLPDGWHSAHTRFAKARSVVGFWIMADGDNTSSKFTTWLRSLTFR